MSNGVLLGICICREAGNPMESLNEVRAIAGAGLEGDRYCRGEGTWNKGNPGARQVTLINECFVEGSGFTFPETRRSLLVRDFELMDHIGHLFAIGGVQMRGVKYCYPCDRPSQLALIGRPFSKAFFERGGLIAEILEDGLLTVGSIIVPRRRK